MWLFLYHIFIRTLVVGEVITLLGETNITCVVTQSSVNSVVYVKPPINADVKYNPLKILYKDWIYDDWKKVSSINSFQGPVTDKRWNDFKLYDDSEKYLPLQDVPTYFSVCIVKKFNFSVICHSMTEIKNFILTGSNENYPENKSYCQWFHYGVMKEGNNVKFFWNNITIQNYPTQCSPEWIGFKNTFSKLHDYTFKVSHRATVDRRSSLSVKLFDSLCLSMFVSLDNDCYLNITLESNGKMVNKTINGYNVGDLKTWKEIKMKAASPGLGNLSFFRGHTNKNMKGYWAIDNIQYCNQDVEIYQTPLPPNSSNEYVCEILDTRYESPVDNTFNNSVCTKAGYLGGSCNISCRSVLGNSYVNCESHKICHNDQICHCAWGYHGEFCTERCNENSWGMDCGSTCKTGCGNCDPLKGCTICKKNFFGNECSELLPVLLNPPVLKSITDHSVIFTVENLDYGENETKPKYYQIQYKSDNDNSFRNYSDAKRYENNSNERKFLIDKLSTREWGYQIKIILIVQNKSFVVPTLVTYKRTLEATVNNDSITLKWKKASKQNFVPYNIQYKCIKRLCPNQNIQSKNISQNTTAKIENVERSTICHIKLYGKLNGTLKYQLLDEIQATTSNDINIKRTEFPKSITISTSYVEMKLENCEEFQGPLIYNLQYSCLSEWCSNETIKERSVPLNDYNSSIKVDVDLLPFSIYNLTITATRFNVTLSRTYPQLKTPSTKPDQVKNLSIYCRNDTALWIRWQNPYPPTGLISEYNISYQERDSTTVRSYLHKTSPCDLWDNFMCAIITSLKKNTSYNVTLQTKNKDFEEWGSPITVISSRGQKAPGPPENLKVKLFSSNEIILTWAHPSFINGPLKKFRIQMKKEGKIKNYTVSVQDYHRIYNYTIVVEYPREYIINVWAVNQFEGEKVKISITTLTPEPDISSIPFVEVCSKRCVLLVPKSKSGQQISVLVKVSVENLIEALYLHKNKPHGRKAHWIVENSSSDENSNYFQFEIDEKKENIVSTKNRNYSMYLIVNDSGSYKYYPLEYRNESDPTKGNIQLVIFIITSILVASLLLAYLYYAYRFKKMPFKNEQRNKRKNDNVPANKTRNLKKSNTPTDSPETLSLIVPSTSTNKDIDVNTKYVKVDDFEEYLMASLEGNRENNELLIQHQGVAKLVPRDCSCGLMPKNLKKNRYKNIIAYDFTRVILEDNNGEDYINANYIDGYQSPKAFIATQAPLPSTIHDFWLMIYQKNVSTIVMLIELEEKDRVICEQYWPDFKQKVRYGKFLIENISTKVYSDYIRRELQVTCNNNSRLVRHLQYTAWQDDIVPLYPHNFKVFMKEILETPRVSPIVVHCNAGCGRSGTVILCDIILKMAAKEKRMNFLKVLMQIREQRVALIFNVHQYIFAHFVVLECLFGKDFSIPVDNFQNEVQKHLTETAMSSFMQTLDKVIAQNQKRLKVHLSLTDEKRVENRFSMILPDSTSQIFLPISSQNISNYIDAVFVDCYQFAKRFIVTQQPLYHKIDDFWKFINERKISTIICLNEMDEKDYNCPIFWPNHNQWALGNSTILHFLSETDNKSYKTINLNIRDGSQCSTKNVNIIEMNNWKRETLTPMDTADLIHIWKEITKSINQIVVTCYDGFTASGLLVALAFLLKKLEEEHVCDVFSAVRTVRQSRTEFVRDMVQVKFLYEAAEKYLEDLGTI